jgi:hypothetical protein
MKLPASANNKLTIFGSIISIASLLLIIILFIASTFIVEGTPYLGIFNLMVLPGVLIFGLILIPLGMYLTVRRSKLRKEEISTKWLVIDLNDTRQRNAVIIFVIGTILFFILSGIGSYEAYHFTESVEFCGLTCHKVMEPEYTAYQRSTHARVACAECHVGSGANWYVKSKLSGLYQVYSVIFNKYPRPLPTPITSLRPARETCEKCHWPQKFYPYKLIYQKHYLADDKNTEWDIDMELKIGASHSSQGLTEGIHWHINPDVRIEYIATPDRETIPWVKYINLATHDTTVYKETKDTIDENTIASSATRLMDCMDCHNRPSHNYLAPQKFIDNAMSTGEISPKLPEIKSVTMKIFNDVYPTVDTAEQVISSTIKEFYKDKYPDIALTKADLIDQAIKGAIKGYRQNIFPYMKASWDAYPDHIGHLEYNGCFRCHNDTHKSSTGKTISKDCNLCHKIMSQGKSDSLQVSLFNQTLEFKHPIDIKDSWKQNLCVECHRYLYQ